MTRQESRVLALMQENGSITSLEAMREVGCMRLAAVIYDLKAYGYNITKDTVSSKNRFGENVHFARYRLNA